MAARVAWRRVAEAAEEAAVVVVDGHPSVSRAGEAPLLPPLPGEAAARG